MIVPIVLAVTAVGAVLTRKKVPGPYEVDEATAAQRRVIYERALNCKDPVALRKLAAGFREQGCIPEANMLDKRVALYELPPEVSAARRDVFRKLMACGDSAKVRAASEVFEEQGCTGAAASLLRYAEGLEQSKQVEMENMSDAATEPE